MKQPGLKVISTQCAVQITHQGNVTIGAENDGYPPIGAAYIKTNAQAIELVEWLERFIEWSQ